MSSTTLSKLIVVFIFAAIAVFAWRKLATLPPPTVEAYAANTRTAERIDHTALDELLKAVVSDGMVDYAGLLTRRAVLDTYLQSLSSVEPGSHPRDALLAMYINAYNAATLRLILDHYPGINSIKDIPEAKRWKDPRWAIAGQTLSLDALEHEVLRARFEEPRIDFAIVCASKGCPILRSEAYVPERLDQQLDEQMHQAHRDPRYLQWDAKARVLGLTPLYDWFKGDFTRGGRSVVQFVAQYCDPAIAGSLRRDSREIRVRYLDWDWSLNGR